ncbi:tRNA (adenosine(37)-N6)-threonylcarbamoyltransferase complex dimerization subunit type 1 TsaB [Legionella sp. km772]|uniref:tRNA (adenosine(37)-N6)-threonylcarbamoyltransferase complex dimerization subunit type 1 TsaB n=1 Tax=Legionella sp. km772 TaxID=2498111 RepID=UPI000F8CA422|nr:tRNA (adenosine(37)-N6)-threonylcarbamoyltransferase complex dimerization subunit type 1 TsaB [Legionella sp. km772]RUR06192.1 tRNA (adenosine(37)-N6)-threonylcarbamoyltransferase complex dimerization subunit type 1 TsaB [Legionella sp. km772]
MKKLLAIDTSTEQASIALLIDGVSMGEEQGSQKTQAQVLLPMIDSLLRKANLHLNQLDGIVFGRGPGSFTGLRIACSIAKGLAYAHDLPLFPVSSLASIAWAARRELGNDKVPVLSLLDARMNELYWGFFPDLSYQTEERVTRPEDILISANEPIVLAGVGTEVYWERLPKALQLMVRDRLALFPLASNMVEMVNTLAIQAVSTAQAQPLYVRNQVTQGDARG